jgi:hypothetical protein
MLAAYEFVSEGAAAGFAALGIRKQMADVIVTRSKIHGLGVFAMRPSMKAKSCVASYDPGNGIKSHHRGTEAQRSFR